MNKEQAIQILAQALEASAKAGVFLSLIHI